MFYPKRTAFTVCFLLMALWACALEISDFRTDDNGDAEISFCGKFKIINIAMVPGSQGWKLEMPLDLGGYSNLVFSSRDLEARVEQCFHGACNLSKKNCLPGWEIVFSKKVTANSALIKVSFDKELTAVFFVNKYMRGDKESYRLSTAMDFKFIDSAYRIKLRNFLIEKTKTLL